MPARGDINSYSLKPVLWVENPSKRCYEESNRVKDSLLRHFAQEKLASGGGKDIMDQIQSGLVLAAVIGAQGSRDIAWALSFEAHSLVSSLGPVGLRSQADSSASYTEKVTPDRTMQVSPNFFPANWPTELNKLYNFKTDDKRADSPWPLEA
ncbi:hypothetical protein TWF106_003927 [Orbilia oligospora]|uniref:Uncharacterized protein n=2 Tax=Orbilia oligospora TaxID=2813651 RepID=A0A7C8V406_ORBOL|nr:hypothetical protein TWF106_003927 [Orbilia oligospora]